MLCCAVHKSLVNRAPPPLVPSCRQTPSDCFQPFHGLLLQSDKSFEAAIHGAFAPPRLIDARLSQVAITTPTRAGGAPNASARHINPPPSLNQTEAAPTAASQASSRRRRRDPGPLDQHINKPLRRHEWSSKDRRWTRHELDSERADFFDTRVLWHPTAPDDSNDDDLDGLATAQSILSAAEISLPTGDLANGVYDSLGNYYQLPGWVVSDPSNLAQDGDANAKGDLSTPDEDSAEEVQELAVTDAQKRREEKGKAVLDLREQMTLRARLSETGRDVQVSMGKSDLARSVARSIALEAALPSNKRIRLAYMGKILRENSTLEAQGWQGGHVINAFVF
ncbi:ubiquitin-binding domain-containing protein [Hirsutella rhossiliensis]|uniref:Ubiquitin-binding domain-containing protein n=1 Tax=Hirsutella rhossiliensis TaxID=111463 RepID=A0A9P8SNG2_9HYPO|nr:ubiquitin-binding domain-containing protein [Hirsutella rhossiliensis]KAH0968359.1 ubiquitin-binding domain-containing protein [Hirsutella rhossiliensis]